MPSSDAAAGGAGIDQDRDRRFTGRRTGRFDASVPGP